MRSGSASSRPGWLSSRPVQALCLVLGLAVLGSGAVVWQVASRGTAADAAEATATATPSQGPWSLGAGRAVQPSNGAVPVLPVQGPSPDDDPSPTASTQPPTVAGVQPPPGGRSGGNDAGEPGGSATGGGSNEGTAPRPPSNSGSTTVPATAVPPTATPTRMPTATPVPPTPTPRSGSGALPDNGNRPPGAGGGGGGNGPTYNAPPGDYLAEALSKPGSYKGAAVVNAPSGAENFALPTRLIIPRIGVNAQVVKIGVRNGAMQTPSGPTPVGWYDFGARPGMPSGNAVFAGHVDWHDYGPAVFWDLRLLGAGDEITVVAGDGSRYTYAVEINRSIFETDFPMGPIIGDTTKPSVTLITCEGQFNPAAHAYDKRRVVRAVLVSSSAQGR